MTPETPVRDVACSASLGGVRNPGRDNARCAVRRAARYFAWLVLGLLALPSLAVSAPVKGTASRPAKAATARSGKPAGTHAWLYDPGNSPLVADVDGRPITRAMIEEKYWQLDPREQPTPDTANARVLLNMMVEKAEFSWLLQERGYTELTAAEDSAFRDYTVRTLRNTLYTDVVVAAGKISRDEVRAFWGKQRINYRSRLIAIDSRPLADSLLDRLHKGDDFTRLAVQFSQDRETRATGGVISYPLTIGFMPAAYESVLTRLQPGGLSPVIEGGGGYYFIFRLDSLQQQELAPFESQEAYLYDKLSRARQAAARDSAYNSLLGRTRIIFNDKVIQLIVDRYTMLGLAKPDSTGAAVTDLSGRTPVFTAEERQLHVLESSHGPVLLGQMIDEIRAVAPAMRPMLISEERAKRYAQTMAMYPVVDEELRARGIDKRHYVQRDLADHREGVLAERFYANEVVAKTPVLEDSVRAFFERNKPLFLEPAAAQCRWIEMHDSLRADSVLKLAQNPATDFEALARANNEDVATLEAGGLSLRFPLGGSQHDTAFDVEIFKHQPGEVIPKLLTYDNAWWIVKVLMRTEPNQLTLADSTGSQLIHARAAEDLQDRTLKGLLAGARKRHPVRYDWENFKLVRLGRTPEFSEL